jgi:hypothetical protein
MMIGAGTLCAKGKDTLRLFIRTSVILRYL